MAFRNNTLNEDDFYDNDYERDVMLRKPLARPSRIRLDGSGLMEKGVKVTQEGTTSFGRKKKHGCRLQSTQQIKQGVHGTTRHHKIGRHADMFPPMPIR